MSSRNTNRSNNQSSECDLKGRAELVPSQCLDPRRAHASALAAYILPSTMDLLQRFLTFDIPTINSISSLSQHLARAAWLVRDAVSQAMEFADDNSPLHEIYREFGDVLFYELEPAEFADTYPQTLAYCLLLAKQSASVELTRDDVVEFVYPITHRLLCLTAPFRSIQIMTILRAMPLP